jgi:hypothetical protein
VSSRIHSFGRFEARNERKRQFCARLGLLTLMLAKNNMR